MTEKTSIQEWVIFEAFGHLKLGGLLSEQQLAGTAMARLDIYRTGDTAPSMTKLFGAAAIYSVTFVSEDLDRAFADGHMPAPVARYELPQLQAPRHDVDEQDMDGDDEVEARQNREEFERESIDEDGFIGDTLVERERSEFGS